MTRSFPHTIFRLGVVAIGLSSMIALTAHARPLPPTNAQVVAAVTRYFKNPANPYVTEVQDGKKIEPKILHIRKAGSEYIPACTYKGNVTYTCMVHVRWKYPMQLTYHNVNYYTFHRVGAGWRVTKTGWGNPKDMPVVMLGS